MRFCREVSFSAIATAEEDADAVCIMIANLKHLTVGLSTMNGTLLGTRKRNMGLLSESWMWMSSVAVVRIFLTAHGLRLNLSPLRPNKRFKLPSPKLAHVQDSVKSACNSQVSR